MHPVYLEIKKIISQLNFPLHVAIVFTLTSDHPSASHACLSALLLIAPYHSTAPCSSLLHLYTTYSCSLEVTALHGRSHPKLSKACRGIQMRYAPVVESDEEAPTTGLVELATSRFNGSNIKLHSNGFLEFRQAPGLIAKIVSDLCVNTLIWCCRPFHRR